MLKAVLFAIAFIVADAILFALAAPLLFSSSNMERTGAAALPVIVLVFGAAGFVFGLRKSKK